MIRNITTVKVGRQLRHRVRITSDPCMPQSQASRVVIYNLLRDIAQLPELTLCGTQMFETMTIRHTQDAWLLEAEAVENLPPEQHDD